jgi:hypothetical protein
MIPIVAVGPREMRSPQGDMLICVFHDLCVPVVKYLGWAFSGQALAVNVSGGRASRAIFAWRYRLGVGLS